ncbi:hypothetical protein BDV28DRAFT_165425 [Aspergillus coremiiformis]|uniref:Uncharacterized protein n=1 Tax=Aspergillus coremiiformis TaxID=138285 RepID=A0A5N6Z4N9_9EURO|nr:hypothetical protein BDV28DRAFT_165425 [Aspergillus coremiiformis]
MTPIIQKLRRKRKLSSELHPRWGDASITYPNPGSWSQYEQSGVGTPNLMPGKASDHYRRHGSLESVHLPGHSSRNSSTVPLGDFKERKSSTDSAMTMPTGHYDARLQGRSMKQSHLPGPGVRHQPHPNIGDSSDESSADEKEGPICGFHDPKMRYHRDMSRPKAYEGGEPFSRASKSPPLSVTSRMRRRSLRNGTPEPPASMPATSSSKHTSYTSSVPSVPSEDPRLGPRPTSHDAKYSRRSKAAPVAEQELVPSYDELYG